MVKMVNNNLDFFKGRNVLVTGHTGFKGSWLTKILLMNGANVIGYSQNPPTDPNLFTILHLDREITSIIGDIRDFSHLKSVFDLYKPEIVLHLAAQPIVRDSYKEPRYTYETNVMGTINVLECIRLCSSVKSFINITTDKVYENNDLDNHPFKEDEKLDGYDPYSNSKSCSDIATHSYYKSFLKDRGVAVSTARAGNVIGGGDFSNDRIIPDCVRSLISGRPMIIRNPNSTRPYQHVLEPLFCYLRIAEKQYLNHSLCGSYNIGPDREDCVTTKELVDLFKSNFDSFKYSILNDGGPHEASFLMLDNTKAKNILGWSPKIHIKEAIKLTSEWTKAYCGGENTNYVIEQQIKEYQK